MLKFILTLGLALCSTAACMAQVSVLMQHNDISRTGQNLDETVLNTSNVNAGMTAAVFTGAGTGFVSRIITTPDADIAEDRTVAATGSYSATAPTKSSNWVMQMVTLKAKP